MNFIPFPLTHSQVSKHKAPTSRLDKIFFPSRSLFLFRSTQKLLFSLWAALLLCLRLGRSTSGLYVHVSSSLCFSVSHFSFVYLLLLCVFFYAYTYYIAAMEIFILYGVKKMPCTLMLVRFHDDNFHHLTFFSTLPLNITSLSQSVTNSFVHSYQNPAWWWWWWLWNEGKRETRWKGINVLWDILLLYYDYYNLHPFDGAL